MKTGKQAKRQRWFETFAENLALFAPAMKRNFRYGAFACPLCFRLFTSPDELSLAHTRQRSLGGRKVTLTCRECNNHIGSEIESYLKNWQQYQSAMSGQGTDSVRATVSIDDETYYTVELTTGMKDEKPLVEMRVVPQASNPESIERVHEKLLHEWESTPLHVSITLKAGWDRARLAYLHAAYLELFHRFGYEWVFCHSSDRIRRQLLNPSESMIEPAMAWLPENDGLPCPDDLLVYIVQEPADCLGFAVVFPAETAVGGRRMLVWLPAFRAEYEVPEGLHTTPITNFTLWGPLADEPPFYEVPDPTSLGRSLIHRVRMRAKDGRNGIPFTCADSGEP